MTDYSPLQVALIALLPKSGERVSVAELAKATAVTPGQVVAAMLGPYMGCAVEFDVRADSYYAPKTGNALPPQRQPLLPTRDNHRKERA